MKRKVLAWLLTLCMVFTMMPTLAFATDGSQTDGAAAISDETTYVAQIGTTGYSTLEGAINAATAMTGEVTIELLTNVEGDVVVTQTEGLKLTIDGKDKVFTGKITVDGQSAQIANQSTTIKNIIFEAANVSENEACIYIPDGSQRYGYNLTVENCTFKDSNNRIKVAAIRQATGGSKNITVVNCTVESSMHSLLQVKNIDGLKVNNCIVNSKNGLNLESSTDVEITDCIINVKGYAIRAGVDTGGNLGTEKKYVVNNNKLITDNTENDPVIVLRASAVDMNLNMAENFVSGATHIKGTTEATIVNADNNYWNGKSAPVVDTGSTAVKVKTYYSDPELEELKDNLPNATVTNLGKTKITSDEDNSPTTHNGSYWIFDLVGNSGLSSASEDFDLQIAMQFEANDTPAQVEASPYKDFITDFYITFDGIKDDSFRADGCYLAGYYPSFDSWVKIPMDGFTVENGKVYPVITSADFEFTYEAICDSVENFVCGIYLSEDVLKNNPDLKVKLELGLSETMEAAQAANAYKTVDSYTYGVPELLNAVAKINDEYYSTFEAAYGEAEAGDIIELLADVKLKDKMTIAKAITIEGNGHSIIADETEVWYTVSGKFNIKNYNKHLIGINSGNVNLKDVTLDCNNNAAGINVYCAQQVEFDRVSIINATKGFAALTVNGSTVTFKNAFTALGNSIALDISNGSGVTSALGVTVEEGTVFDLDNKVVKFASVAVNDMAGAVNAEGKKYFAAMDNAYFYTQAQIDDRTSAYNNGLILLDDVKLIKDYTIEGTLDLNNHELIIVDGSAINVKDNLTVDDECSYSVVFSLIEATSKLTGPANLNVKSGIEGYYVTYENGEYKLAVAVAEINGKYYGNLQEALDTAAANTDGNAKTVLLIADVEENAYATVVPSGVTLNLNGHYVAAKNVLAFGDVIDTAEEAGGIVISNDTTKAFVQLQPGNGTHEIEGVNYEYIPLYDTENGCYRFYEGEFRAQMAEEASGDAVKLYVRIHFTSDAAYSTLANSSDPGLNFKATISWTNAKAPLDYTFSRAGVINYANKEIEKENNQVITLRISGINNLGENVTMTVTPYIVTNTDYEAGVGNLIHAN